MSMADKENEKLFSDALFAAWRELNELKEQERKIAFRKAQLQATLNALSPLVFEQTVTDINTLSLPDAMRLIMRSANRPLSSHDMRTKLDDLGFDLTKFENPMANILTAMKRMVESEEFIWTEDGSKKVLPGPELKPAPERSYLEEILKLSLSSGGVAADGEEKF